MKYEVKRLYNLEETYIKINNSHFTPYCTYLVYENDIYVGELFYSYFGSYFKIGMQYFSIKQKSFRQFFHKFIIKDLESGMTIGTVNQAPFRGLRFFLSDKEYAVERLRGDDSSIDFFFESWKHQFWEIFSVVNKNIKLVYDLRIGKKRINSDAYSYNFEGAISFIGEPNLLMLFTGLYCIEFDLYLTLRNPD